MKADDDHVTRMECEKAELQTEQADLLVRIDDIKARLEALDLAISALTSTAAVPQLVQKKTRRRAKIKRTSPQTQRAIEAHCFGAIAESKDKRLTTIALSGQVEQHFGVGRSLTAIDQMLAVCPGFVRGAPGEGWRCIKEDEWDAAYAHAAERGWPGSEDFELACYGEEEEDEDEESWEPQGRLDFSELKPVRSNA